MHFQKVSPGSWRRFQVKLTRGENRGKAVATSKKFGITFLTTHMRIWESPLSRAVKSADRTLEIFELFFRERRPMSLKEIAEELGFPASSTNYLLKSLSTGGYLNYNKRYRSYFPTSRMKSVTSWIDDYLPESSEIMDTMKQLRREFGETVAIGIRNDLNLQYLKALESDYPIRYHIDEGAQRPLIEAAMGWVILAGLSDEKIDTIYRRTEYEDISRKISFKDLIAAIEKVRKAGYCYSNDQTVPYFASTIAVKLAENYNNQAVVIGLGGERKRISLKSEAIVARMKLLAATTHDSFRSEL